MQNKMMKWMLFFFGLFFANALFATELPMDIAVLRGLDKVTGRINTFSIPVGQTGQFGKTFVVPEACYTRPPEESPENSVFLYVFEKSLKGENIELFKGWMFSSNPALSSMEHPVYDIWVIGCEKNIEEVPVKEVNIDSSGIPTENVIQSSVISDNAINTDTQTITTTVLIPSDVEMEEL